MLDEALDAATDGLAQAAEAYAREVFGSRLLLEPFVPKALPHFLLDRYRFWRGDVRGRPAVFMAIVGQSVGAAADVLKHRDTVRRHLDTPLVILLLEAAPAPLRRRLVENHIAFLAPGSQMYIPEILLDLRETPASGLSAPSGKISPTAQVVILAALLGHDVHDTSLTALADRYQTAIMSMSRALDELEALEVAKPRRVGRQRRLNLAYRGGDLWRAVERRLQSPVRKVRAVRGRLSESAAPLAGETALAWYTMLAAPKVERRAAPASAWKRMIRQYELEPATAYDDDRIEVETWSYDPLILTREPAVDRLSLYLSVRSDPDERVAQAAENLLEPFGW